MSTVSTQQFSDCLNRAIAAGKAELNFVGADVDPTRIRGLTSPRGFTLRNAVFRSPLTLDGWDGIGFDGCTFDMRGMPAAYWAAITGYGVKQLTVRNSTFVGPVIGGASHGQALSIRSGEGITVERNRFKDIGTAGAFNAGSRIKVADNDLHGIREGFQFGLVSQVEIARNLIGPFYAVATDHRDGIQFMTTGAKPDQVAAHDVLIADNCIRSVPGARTQGIFISDQAGMGPDRWFRRFRIRDNVLIGCGWHGIAIHGDEHEISGNDLYDDVDMGRDPVHQNWISFGAGSGRVFRNRADKITLGAGIAQDKNTIRSQTTQKQRDAAYAAWTARFRAAPLTPAPVDQLTRLVEGWRLWG